MLAHARPEVLALQHARQAVVGTQPNHVLPGHFAEPFTVVANFSFLGVEYLVNLVEIGGHVRLYLFAGQRRTGLRLAAGVAHHRGEVAYQKDGGVSHILKVFQLAQHHGVAQVNVRRGRIHAELRPQRLSGLRRGLEFRFQIFFADNFRGALAQVGKLLIHRQKLAILVRHYLFSGTTITRRPSMR